MKKRTKITSWILLLTMLVGIVQPLCDTETYQAATSYTNAKEFYENTYTNKGSYHVDTAYGKVYYATQAKVASSSTNTKYRTIGFDVMLSGNGYSVSFTVQRTGGSLTLINSIRSGNYEYDLYAIKEDKLYELATKADAASAAYVLDAATINVKMDAIMTTISAGNMTPNGGITENGYGGFTRWGTIYRLKNSTELQALKNIFSGHLFESYTNIYADLENYLLKVRYNVLGLNPTGDNPILSSNFYTFDSAGFLQKSGATYFDESRTLKKITLLNTGSIGLSKTGYYLPADKEWITENDQAYADNTTYQSTTVDPTVGYQNHGITLYANWKPNTYTITYHANGGTGTMTDTKVMYDKSFDLKSCTFSRTGYRFAGWATSPNGAVFYTDKQQGLKNLTSVNEGEIKLYAVWLPDVCEITLDNDGADVSGTDVFFQKYETGYYADTLCMIDITSITTPQKTGYTFGGYFDAKNGGGECHIDGNGTITATNTTFRQDRTIYAKWTANTYTIRYHVGIPDAGLADTAATYDKDALLRPNVYTRRGYTFMGWARTEGGAVVYADKETVKNITSVNGAVIDLYAVWEPVTAQITLNPQEGSGGTGYFYEKFGVNFYTNNMFTAILDRISIPARTGYDFKGYFADMFGSGTPLIDTNGSFGFDSTYFVQDSTLFAKWLAKTYPLTLNKEGGTGGTDSVTATYDRLVPGAEAEVVPRIHAPARYGFEFKGYYTGKNGIGTRFYNEFMYSDIVYKSTTGTQLYAYWVDNYAPDVSLSGNDKWTNQQTTLTASASDDGVGLKSLTIYRVAEDGSLTAVATASNLNGAKSKELAFANTLQGVTRYKAVAVDLNGNTAESYSTVYYDITKPTGTVVQFTQSGNSFTIIVDVTDANISN